VSVRLLPTLDGVDAEHERRQLAAVAGCLAVWGARGMPDDAAGDLQIF